MIKESFGGEKVIVLSNNDNFQCILKRTKEKTITKEYFEKIQKNISEKTGYTTATVLHAAAPPPAALTNWTVTD